MARLHATGEGPSQPPIALAARHGPSSAQPASPEYRAVIKPRLISLGNFCQTAYQLRRITGDERASFFDWLVTPADALVRVLEADFAGVFEPANLALTEDGTGVRDREN